MDIAEADKRVQSQKIKLNNSNDYDYQVAHALDTTTTRQLSALGDLSHSGPRRRNAVKQVST